MMKIAVYSGTKEGKEMIDFLLQFPCFVTSFVATNYGKTLNEKTENLIVKCGRLDEAMLFQEFQKEKYDLVIDCTHPYADVVSKNVKNACQTACIKYIRCVRKGVETSGNAFKNATEVAEFLSKTTGNILLTTGSKELSIYASHIDASRLFARVLPCSESILDAEKAQLISKNIFAIAPPFSVGLNQQLIEKCNAKYMVTKICGTNGGYEEKVQACENLGVELLEINPNESKLIGEDIDEIKRNLAEILPSIKREIHIVGVGMGNTKTITPENLKVISKADVVFGASRLVAEINCKCKVHSTYNLMEISEILDSNKQFVNVCILASGDVGFYSIAKSVREKFTDYKIQSYAGLSSISYFAAKINTSYQDAYLASFHGKTENLPNIVNGNKKCFFLLDNVKNILKSLVEYGFCDVVVTIGENLSYENQRITRGTALELMEMEFSNLAVMLVENQNYRKSKILFDEEFKRGKVPMTKAEIRYLSLAKMNLSTNDVVYDVGAGTGGMTCEIALNVPLGKVYAIERNSEAYELIRENSKNLKLGNIVAIHGQAQEEIASLETPNKVFIGGSSGNLVEIVKEILKKNPLCEFVMNIIALETLSDTLAMIKVNDFQYEITQIQCSNGKKLGDYNLMMSNNPIYVVSFRRKNDSVK